MTSAPSLREQDRQDYLALATAYQSSARSELIARVTQRDTALSLYLGAVAVVVGFAFGQGASRPQLLLLVPLLSLGSALLYAQHNDVIGHIEAYLTIEQPKAIVDRVGWQPPMQVDAYRSLAVGNTFLRLRYAAPPFLLVGPSVAAVLAVPLLLDSAPWATLGTIAGGFTTVVALVLLVVSNHERARQRSQIRRHYHQL